jgi:hypothetical protein
MVEKELALVINGNLRKKIILSLAIPNIATNLAKKLDVLKIFCIKDLIIFREAFSCRMYK